MSIKLSFSLLALRNIKEIESLLKILNKEKIKYIEIPISKFLPEYNIDIAKIYSLKKLLERYEIKISSVQAIFFKKNLNIFNLKQKKQTILHLNKIINICEILDIKNIIFGSPKNRLKNKLHINYANRLFKELLSKISKKLKDKKINFCIEPNARFYGCDFINNVDEALVFVKYAKLSNIFINFDTGNSILENEKINIFKNDLKYFRNFQISEKKLQQLSSTPKIHINILKKFKLDNRYLSLEMLNIDLNKIQKNIKKLKLISKQLN